MKSGATREIVSLDGWSIRVVHDGAQIDVVFVDVLGNTADVMGSISPPIARAVALAMLQSVDEIGGARDEAAR